MTVKMMANDQIYHLRINPVFKDLIPPLSEEEYQTLEANLRNEGCREPICVWNYTILDGHNRYEICTRLSIPFQIKQINLFSEAEAIAWICANQLGRRNISEETRRYLIGKRYEAEKSISWDRNPDGANQHSAKNEPEKSPDPVASDLSEAVRANKTSAKLGHEYNLSRPTVIKYGQYARAIEKISEVDPIIADQILSGTLKLSQNSVIDLAKLKNSRIKRILEQMAETMEERNQQSKARRQVREETAKSETQEKEPVIEIKNMPAPDANADIVSLSLTIPNWTKMMVRAKKSTTIENTSITARAKLFTSLAALRRTTDLLMDWLKENMSNGV